MSEEFFPGIGRIEFNPNAKPDETLVFKHYNADQVVLGRSMAEWLRFSVCFWHTFRGNGLDPFGMPTLNRPWDGPDNLMTAEKRLRAAFEFFTKLGIRYWTFHDRDIAPEGDDLATTNKNLDHIVELAEKLMKETGVKLLWATCNLFANPRFMLGAATSADAHVMAYAGAQVKKGLEVAKRLRAENFVFWGGREGYQSLLNTDLEAELRHMANFFHMVVEYKNNIGFTGQLLVEPKAKEPTRHQYDFDAMTVIGFLKSFNLDKHFKLNIEPNHTTLAGHCFEHDVAMASAVGMLGSVDSNTGSADMGWDTDQFPMLVRDTTAVMQTVIAQKGLQPGGLNFDCKVRRESTELADIFIAHIGAMDAFARGLKNAARIVEDGVMSQMLAKRYHSFTTGIGEKLDKGKATLEDCEEYINKEGNPSPESGKQEHFESVYNHYV